MTSFISPPLPITAAISKHMLRHPYFRQYVISHDAAVPGHASALAPRLLSHRQQFQAPRLLSCDGRLDDATLHIAGFSVRVR